MDKVWIVINFCLLMTGVVQAEMLVGYDFDEGSSNATVVADYVTASALTSPMDIAYATTSGDTSGVDADGDVLGSTDILGGVGVQVTDAITSSFDDAVSGDDYLSFTVTPDTGHQLNLSSLSFKATKKADTSVDEYAVTDSSGALIGSTVIVTNVVGLTGTYDGFVVDLSDRSVGSIMEATELRIYAWGRGSTSTINTLAVVDKVVLNGTSEDTLLIGYDFDTDATDPSAATVAPDDVTVSQLTSPMDIEFVDTASDNSGVDACDVSLGSTNSIGAVGIQVIDATASSFAAAVTNNDYISFTVTPDSDVGLELSVMTFKATKKATTSVDEYAIADASGHMIGSSVLITNVVGLTGEYDGVVIDLSDSSLELITEATEFRIYAWGRDSTQTVNTLAAIDKISLHGSSFSMGGDSYVSITGDDSATGSASNPFATIQYAIEQANPGSTIYIRGGTYYEDIDLSGIAGISGYPITLTPYEDETVTLDGTSEITSEWTLDEGNIYKTTLSEDITQLFVDGEIMTLARFPNAEVYSDDMWTERTSKQNSSGRYVEGEDIVGEAGVSFDGCIGMFNFGNYETIMATVYGHTAGSNTFYYTPTAGIYRTSDEYFLEGGVDDAERVMLDMAQEWAYDESTKTLYLWADDGENPYGREIAGKVQTFAITGDATTQNIVIDGLDFFATTFEFICSDGITIQNCDSFYHTASDRAIGSIDTPEPAQVVGTEDDYCEDIYIYNNTFQYSDTAALVCSYLQDPIVENNYFEDINYTCVISTAVQTSQAQNLTLRRNTLINAGPFAGFRFGRNGDDESFEPFTLEYNYTEKCSQLQEDGTAFYSASTSIVGSVWRYNWAYDNYEIDYRFDGANNPLTGVEANIYRNVALATTHKQVNQIGGGYKLKGDYHEIYNNIAVQNRADFEVSIEKGGNTNSFTYNNAGDKLVGNDDGDDVPGTESNNFNAQDEPRRMLDILRDPYNLDFRPKSDAVEFIDQGREVTAEINGELVDVTAGYNGDAPDIGAYEYGDENYTIPGYQFPQASTPYPADGRTNALYDTDLMWLGGLDSISYKIYLGTDSNSLALVESQTNNIYTPDEWTNDQTYFWRIDSVLSDSSVVTGDIWSYTISDHEPRAYSSREAVEEDGSVSFEISGYDPDGGSLSYTITSQPSYGTLTGTAPDYEYTPDADYFGTDSIVYTVNNGTSTSDWAIVIFDVENDAADSPYFQVDPVVETSAIEGVVYSNSITNAVIDLDEQDLSYAALSGPSWLNISTNGILSGTPSLADLGVNSWELEVTDPTGLSATADLEIRVIEGDLYQLSFEDLDTSTTSNALMLGDSSSNLTVTGAADGDDYLYSVVYDGADYDGDLSNDSLSFDVRVKGWSGGTTDTGIDSAGSCNIASATIGTTASSVSISSSTLVVGSSSMSSGESLEYELENMEVSLTDTQQVSSVFSAGFTSARMEQTSSSGNSHQAIFGEGTGLLGWDFDTNQESGSLNVGIGSLYISADVGSGTRSTSWGVANVDFDLEVVIAAAGSYTEWAATYDLSDTLASEDSDGDGVSNLDEYYNDLDPLVSDAAAGIRVTEYYLSTNDFSGTVGWVALDQKLADDYFVLVRGSRTGNGESFPNNDYARVTAVPWGTGDMSGSGSSYAIKITRGASDHDWEGVVTVVECTSSDSPNGFTLLDIVESDLTGMSGTDTCEAWSDMDQVVLFGGYRGGGVMLDAGTIEAQQGSSAYTRVYPSGTNTLNWSRDAAGETLLDATMTTFVVEWGSSWDVQHVNVAGSNGGDGANATNEYSTAEIDSVDRDSTWVWATGTRADAGVGDCAEACLVTLGDGVNQNDSESTVAVGSEYTDAYDFDVYTLTHTLLAVDYRFKTDGDSSNTDVVVAVDSAEEGARFGWVYNGCNGTGDSFPRPKFWSLYTADEEVTISHGYSGQKFPAWVQGIDFSGLND